jgi:hypothetical protein
MCLGWGPRTLGECSVWAAWESTLIQLQQTCAHCTGGHADCLRNLAKASPLFAHPHHLVNIDDPRRTPPLCVRQPNPEPLLHQMPAYRTRRHVYCLRDVADNSPLFVHSHHLIDIDYPGRTTHTLRVTKPSAYCSGGRADCLRNLPKTSSLLAQSGYLDYLDYPGRTPERLPLTPRFTQPSLHLLLDQRTFTFSHRSNNLEHQSAGWGRQVQVVTNADKGYTVRV